MRGAGWTFIWVGIFTMGFVVHQIYVTTWFAQQEQNELEAERIEHFEEVASEIRPVIVDEDFTPIADAVTGEVIEPDPTYTAPIPIDDPTGGTGVASELPPPEPSDAPLVIFPEPEVKKGTAFASIRIPSIDRLKDGWTIVEGVELRQLRKGAGHMPWTPYPGQRGNSVISGHRTTWGAPFHELDQLESGDRIEVETAVGVHIYEVRDVRIVKPSALWVTNPRDGAWLTLTTCHPKFSARQRLIVFAEMVAGPNFDTIHRLTG
jgi:sortase A